MRARRRTPPLWILLDILLLWVMALLSLPPAKTGIEYEFRGIPEQSVVFAVDGELSPDHAVWTHLDNQGRWVTGRDVTPFGRENYLCESCAQYLDPGVHRPQRLLISVPVGVQEDIQRAVFESCRSGTCNTRIEIHGDGSVATRALQ
jgi:hypothetical protein